MTLDYPQIIASTTTPIHMTHDVHYRTNRDKWHSDDWGPIRKTSMRFAVVPKVSDIIETLRTQLGIDDTIEIEIVEIGPFTNNMNAA
jgi:hypothetical protein